MIFKMIVHLLFESLSGVLFDLTLLNPRNACRFPYWRVSSNVLFTDALIYKFQQHFYQLLTTQRLIESDFLQLFRIDSWYEKQERTLTSAFPSNTMED